VQTSAPDARDEQAACLAAELPSAEARERAGYGDVGVDPDTRGSSGPALLLSMELGSAGPAAAFSRGCRVNPAWRGVAVEISNEPAVSAVGVTAELDDGRQHIVAVGDIHTAKSFPDSVSQEQQRRPRAARCSWHAKARATVSTSGPPRPHALQRSCLRSASSPASRVTLLLIVQGGRGRAGCRRARLPFLNRGAAGVRRRFVTGLSSAGLRGQGG
jgi:hypothetical protein